MSPRPSGLLQSRALAALLVLCGDLCADDGVDFFESRIRPVLAENCLTCHADATRKGGLSLASREGWQTGGDSGPAIVPGAGDQSLLLKAVRYRDAVVRMPPKGPLAEQAIADFEKWIAMGAPDPRSRPDGPDAPPPTRKIDFAAARTFWAYRPLAAPAVPSVANAAWVRDPLDAFVLAGLERAGLAPAPEADRRTLIRRASFDLIGLAPTPGEVDAFVADESDGAFERVVDRLLASPHYGERWGRHWLDLVRYADSNGVDENLAMRNAYRYRDYVVDRFNRDVPYARFVEEQLAGDLIDSPCDEAEAQARIVATGFLVLGPKMLAEQDKEKLVMDLVDEQLDVIGRTFLGLTIGCARCHDHKFDPIPTRDYYALAGILKSTSAMQDLAFLSQWRERELATPAEIASRDAWRAEKKGVEAARDAARAAGAAARRTQLAADWPRVRDEAKALRATAIAFEAEAFADASLLPDDRDFGRKDVVFVRTQRPGPQYVEWSVAPPRAGRYALWVRYASGEPRPLALLVNGVAQPQKVCGENTGGFQPEHRRFLRQCVVELKEGENRLRLQDAPHFPHLDSLMLLPCVDDEPRAEVVAALDFVRRCAETGRALPERGDDDAGAKELFGDHGAFGAAVLEDASGWPEAPRKDFAEKQAALDAVDARKPKDFDTALAVIDGTPADVAVCVRGNHLDRPGAPVARGALQLLDDCVPPLAIPAGHSGRLELARWIASPANPLTWRVAANRIWQGHFGEGICRSPSNFSVRGDVPAQPELLDYLATELLASGGSWKSLHRRILLSSTWRMSSRLDERALAADPENRLLWRQNRRRLDAESIRDALLQAGGALDLAMGGTLLGGNNREYVTNDQSQEKAQYGAPRRSIYLPVVRNAMYGMFATFDYPDPSVPLEQRTSTVVASQALFLMNSPLAIDEAGRLADRALAVSGDDAARVAFAWREALQRPPSDAERDRALRFLADSRARLASPPLAARDRESLAALAQVLLASNEFLHVD